MTGNQATLFILTLTFGLVPYLFWRLQVPYRPFDFRSGYISGFLLVLGVVLTATALVAFRSAAG